MRGSRCPVTSIPRPAPDRLATLIVHTGFDGTQEELRAIAPAANARGVHCVTFEGPGQGAVIREQRLPFRPDWEAVVTPVVDHALTLPGVDPARIALLGLSFGGYLAPRAAAFEHRLAACIANGSILDYMAPNLPPGMTRQTAAAWIRDGPQAADKLIRDLMNTSTDTRWAVQNGMFTFASSSPAAWFLAALDYTLTGVALWGLRAWPIAECGAGTRLIVRPSGGGQAQAARSSPPRSARSNMPQPELAPAFSETELAPMPSLECDACPRARR